MSSQRPGLHRTQSSGGSSRPTTPVRPTTPNRSSTPVRPTTPTRPERPVTPTALPVTPSASGAGNGGLEPATNPSPATASDNISPRSRKPTPSFRQSAAISPAAAASLLPEQDTLNFHRRPSMQFDQHSARSIHAHGGAGEVPPPLPSPWQAGIDSRAGMSGGPLSPGPTGTFDYPRSPLSPTAVAPPPTPSSTNPGQPTGISTATSPALPGSSGARTGSESHRRKSSHSRQPSISLSSQPQFPATYSMGAPIGGAKSVLPPEPVPTRTRAPIESFASVEMLQGQREVQERRRGSEVFRDGRYEGRGISQPHGFSSGEAFSATRRPDPTDHVRTARGSNRMTGQMIPPIDVDVASIAHQLREHDQRRGSDNPLDWRRYSVTDEAAHDAVVIPTPNFSFPARPSATPLNDKAVSAVYTLDDDDSDVLTYDEKSGHSSASLEKFGSRGSWRTENLGGPDAAAFGGYRPSIVALPVYPAPNGSLAQSWRWKAKKTASYLTWITVSLSTAATITYFYRRIFDLIVVEKKHPGLFVNGWIFLSLELSIATFITFSALFNVITYSNKSGDPKLRLRGDKNLPAVDVFIVSSGQSDQAIFDCAVAAASMEYPAHRFRVMVLDPNSSPILERDIKKHAKTQGCPHLTYHRRQINSTAGDLFHTKSSSINFGMKEAGTFGIKGPAEFIAVLDADMIPERNFLRASLPSILTDAKVALVRTRHGFINLPQRLSQSTATLMNSAEYNADSRSGFILRRSAITEIGGFPAEAWIHDGLCEALLAGRGYTTAKVEEILQWGMCKPTYGNQVHQMMVNRLGPLRTAIKLRFFLGGQNIKLMSFWARLRGIGRALDPLLSILFVIMTAAYPFMFTYGGIIVLTPNLPSLNLLLQSCLFMLITTALHELVWSWTTGLPSPHRDLQAWVFAAPYQTVALVRMLLPTWLGGYSRHSDLDLNLTSPPVRPPFLKRLWWLIIDPHSGVLFAFVSSIGVAIWRATRDYERGTVDMNQTALTILLTVAWPSMVWVDLLYGSIVPYSCLLFPSRLLTERRESFLIRDTYSSVARPKHAFKTHQPFKVNHASEFLTSGLILGWGIACVVVGVVTQLFA